MHYCLHSAKMTTTELSTGKWGMLSCEKLCKVMLQANLTAYARQYNYLRSETIYYRNMTAATYI